MNVVLIKYSEIWLKGKNRRLFEDRLVKNIVAVTGIKIADVVRMRSRMYIKNVSDNNIPTTVNFLRKVFGIHAYTVARKISDDIEEIKETSISLVKEKVGASKTFAVKARHEEGYEFNSTEINTLVGQGINDTFKDLSVNLDNPDITIFIEVRSGETFIYTSKDEQTGPGGLPVGVSGKALSLISGGIDSPVASWLSMKRGLFVDGVYFHSAPYTSKKAEEKVVDLARVLSSWNVGSMKLFVPAFGKVQKYITDEAPEEYWTILFRRSMRRIAEIIAKESKYKILISGDNLAQVASQTPENLTVSEKGNEFLMIRPVIGYDKQEIMDLAQKIDTYNISIQPFEDCCSVFTPNAPKTKARWVDVEKIEKRLDLDDIEKDALENSVVYTISPEKVESVAFTSTSQKG